MQPTFKELYDQYNSRVYNTVLGYVQNAEDAEELTQDVFIEVHRSLQSFEARASAGTWIYRISINRTLDFLKAKKRKKRFAFLTSLFDDASGDLKHDNPHFIHPGVLLENKERSATLFASMDLLPEKQKTAFILAKLEGLGNKEIAEVMGMSVGAVESLLSRAKENLRKDLEKKL
jgi:RNA polymerase sigma-70 factor (ECF subfamily)